MTKQCQRIPNDIVQSYFEDLSNISTTQILMLLYVLQFNDYVIAFRTEPKLMALASSSTIALEQTGMYYFCTLFNAKHFYIRVPCQ